MDDHDPQSFRELFDAEPTDPTSPETTRWVEIYRSLIAMMERQLEETRTFAERAPMPCGYLSRENIAILEEELAFKAGPLDERGGGTPAPHSQKLHRQELHSNERRHIRGDRHNE